ncbi:MAG: asparagine synthase (glutamine-hydrolyzing) [Kiritimatiellia bacterium]|jgi:asparagine synthase (glutamine-hydrolysing)
MCGIFGAITPSGLPPEVCERIDASMQHRGPDGKGHQRFALENRPVVDFLHRRLSIIDLSTAASQPMAYADERYWITFNGEIYNYIELRDELKARGAAFRTQSDTEVILAAYAEWGAECVHHFNGDWAFCIFDSNEQRLFLSRDRVGVKPLYLFRQGASLYFASEIKSLLTLPDGPSRTYDPVALHLKVVGNTSDYSEATMYRDIRQIPSGHRVSIDLASGEERMDAWWTPEVNHSREPFEEAKAKTYAAEIRAHLEDAVRLRLRSDVPVGTCLSGGLDSSAIVAIIAGIKGAGSEDLNGLRTFTAAYPGDAIDEEKWARSVIDQTHCEPHFVYPKGEEFASDLDELLASHDEVFGSSTVYAQYRVMQLVSEHVTVVLDGQAADEIYGGYPRHQAAFLRSLVSPDSRTRSFAAVYFASRFSLGIADRLLLKKTFQRKARLVEEMTGIACPWNEFLHHMSEKCYAPLARNLFQDVLHYNLPRLLKYEDTNSMHFSIESRVPFTDYRLIEHAFQIPAAYKIHKGYTKYILRRAVEDLLPASVVWRTDKIGFATPEQAWLDKLPRFQSFLRERNLKASGDRFWWRLFQLHETLNKAS